MNKQFKLNVKLEVYPQGIQLYGINLKVILPTQAIARYIQRLIHANQRIALKAFSIKLTLFQTQEAIVLPTEQLNALIFERAILSKLTTVLKRRVSVHQLETQLAQRSPELLNGWRTYRNSTRALERLRWLTPDTLTEPPWISLQHAAPRPSSELQSSMQSLTQKSDWLALRFWRGYCKNQETLDTMRRLEPDLDICEEIERHHTARANQSNNGGLYAIRFPDGLIFEDRGYRHIIINGMYELRSPSGNLAASVRETIPPYVLQQLSRLPREIGETGLVMVQELKA